MHLDRRAVLEPPHKTTQGRENPLFVSPFALCYGGGNFVYESEGLRKLHDILEDWLDDGKGAAI
jgi:hypothetical protein